LGLLIEGGETKNIAALTYNYGHVLLRVGDDQEARSVLQKAGEIFEKVYGKEAEKLIDPLMDLGTAFAHRNIKTQIWNYNRALNIIKNVKGKNNLLYAEVSIEAGSNLLIRSRSSTAKSYIKNAYNIYHELLGEKHYKTGLAAFHLGKFALSAKKYRTAEKYFNSSLAIFEVSGKPSNSLELTTHAFLVEVYENKHERDKATAHCQAIGSMKPWDASQMQVPLFKMSPKYPQSALLAMVEGETILAFTVTEAGMVIDPEVDRSSGDDRLDKAAMEAIEKWRYAPRFVDGKPVKSENSRAKVIFSITD